MKLAYIVKCLSTTQKAEKVVAITKVQGMKKKKKMFFETVCMPCPRDGKSSQQEPLEEHKKQSTWKMSI